MAVEQVKAFFAKVNDDSQLAQKLKDAEKAYTGDKSDKDAFIAAVFIPIAAQAGFNFTAEDFKAVFDKLEEGEASKDELNAVAGGVYCPLGGENPGFDECGVVSYWHPNRCNTQIYVSIGEL